MKRFFVALGLVVLASAAAIAFAQFTGTNQVPAFHPKPPAARAKLPPILTEKQLADQGLISPAQKESYKAAARASAVVYQQPCYCYCDRNHGHSSLRSCFEGTHGANCGTCMQESLYTYRMSKKGWSAKMIRDGIIRGEFKTMDLQNVAPVN